MWVLSIQRMKLEEQRLLKLAVVQWVAGNFQKIVSPSSLLPKKIHPEMAGGRRASFFFPHLDPKGVVTQSYGPVVHLVGEA